MTNKNVWRRLYEEERLSDSSDWNLWRCRIENSATKWRLRFFALAKYEANSGKPLKCDDVYGEVGIPRREFNFRFESFCTNREDLQRELLDYGVTLLQAGNGFQYLRTIHRLSGALYMLIAKKIHRNKIPISSWFSNDGTLSQDIVNWINPYINGEDNPTNDVAVFLMGLKKSYERYNECPTVEECFCGANTLSHSMVKRILKELHWNRAEVADGGEDTDVAMFETRPILSLNEERCLVVKFPTRLQFNVSENANCVSFAFKKTNELISVITFRRSVDDSWQMDVNQDIERGIPVEEFTCIERSVWRGRERAGDDQDVTPSVLCDSGLDHVMFRVDVSQDGGLLDMQRIVPPRQIIPSGCFLYVVGLNQANPKIDIISDEGTDKCNVKIGEAFQVPAEAESIRVGDVEYPVKTKANDWIDVDCCRWTGARLFCERRNMPFSEEFIRINGVNAFYRTFTGNEYPLSICDGECSVHDEIIWDKGWIVFRNNKNEEITKRALTFIPNIDDSVLDNDLDIGEEKDVDIGFDDERIRVSVPKLKTKVVLDRDKVRGFSNFAFAIKRKGFYYSVSGTEDVIPLSVNRECPTMIAYDDFNDARFSGVTKNGHNITVCGMEGVTTQGSKFSGHDIKSLLRSVGETLEFCSESGDRAYARVYYPEKTPASEENRHPVQWWRQGDDLFVKFWIARRWMNWKLIYVYYPAHRQDDLPFTWNDVSTHFDESHQDGRVSAVMHIKGIYASEIDWGCGLLSFIGVDKGVGRYRPVSSGFFLRSENADNFQLKEEEDPYGLRMAMARCDINVIENIMQTSDAAARNWIREFERKTLCSLNKIGSLDYFHAYLSHCIQDNGHEEVSGYFFMAGWLLLEKMESAINDVNVLTRKLGLLTNVRKGILPENYSRAWSTLLIADRYFKEDCFIHEIGIPEDGILDQRFNDARSILGNNESELLCENGRYRRIWTSCRSFNDQGAVYLVDRLFKLIYCVRSNFPFSTFKPEENDKYFVDFGGDFNGRQSAKTLEKCVSRLAWWVANWRRSPSLEGAQLLRNFLIEVAQIDSELHRCIRNQKDDYNEDDGTNWLPQYSILERIALKADVFREVISQSNNE